MEGSIINSGSPGPEWDNGEELGPLADRMREAFPAVRPPEAFTQALKGQLLRAAAGEGPSMTTGPAWSSISLVWGLVTFVLLGVFLYRWLKRGLTRAAHPCSGASITS